MKRNRMFSEQLCLFGLVSVLAWSTAARGQAWVGFVESPSSISATNEVIFDLPCDANCTGTCDSTTPCSGVCNCACEKDMAVGDLNGDGDDDLVMVRIQPFLTGGGVSNLLFMNQNGTMVDRTADLAPSFADLTQDRDVVIVDVDRDVSSNLNMPDVVIASTFGEQPRVYMNLGCCSTACTPSSPCPDENKVVCSNPGATWCGLKYDPTENRIPTFSPVPFFCGVADGDVDMDGCRDLYFVDYGNTLEDRLLFNIKDPQTGACTGFFDDVTETPSTRMCPNGPPCFNESGFGTGARIIDVDLDFNNDIVKGEDTNLDIFYNDAANIGHFNVNQDLRAEFGTPINSAYMFAAGDMNSNGGVDLYVVRSPRFVQDVFLINECFQSDPLPAECDRGDGTVQFLPPKAVTGTNRTDYPGGNVSLIDLDGDSFRDVLLTDVDVEGSFCTNTFRLLHTTTDPLDPLDVTVSDPTGGDNCAWNTNMTYDFAVLDINGDSKPDLWSGHARGNQVFLWELPLDCDANGVPDRCAPGDGATPGGENSVGACCMPNGSCIDTFRECCDLEPGNLFKSRFNCATFGCFPAP